MPQLYGRHLRLGAAKVDLIITGSDGLTYAEESNKEREENNKSNSKDHNLFLLIEIPCALGVLPL